MSTGTDNTSDEDERIIVHNPLRRLKSSEAYEGKNKGLYFAVVYL